MAKTLNYFLGLVDEIPVYCNVEETIKNGKFVPLYTSKRKVKNHNSIVKYPENYFSSYKLQELYRYIENTYKIYGEFCFSGNELRLDFGCYNIGIKTAYCPSIKCGRLVIIHENGFSNCPFCNRRFIP